MTTQAVTRWVGALSSAALCVALAGCQWEAERASASRGELSTAGFFYDPDERNEDSCLANQRSATTEGCPRAPTGPFPGCGVSFEAAVSQYGACDTCGDCPLTSTGSAECTCRGQDTTCLFHGAENDGSGCGCGDRGVLCDCGDGRGEVYICECEGGGDECGCRDEPPC